MHFNFIIFIACELQMILESSGQRACVKDRYVVDSCSGQVISNNNVLLDFGIIETQCDCKVSSNFSGEYFYGLAENPGYDNCGTAIEIAVENNTIFRLPCSRSPDTVYGTSIKMNHTVKFIPSIDPLISGNSGYCVRVASNEKSNHFHVYCGKADSSRSTTADYQLVSTGAVLQRNTTGSRDDTTNSLQWIIIGAISGGSVAILTIFTAISVWIHKRHSKDLPYMKETSSSQQVPEKEKRVESGLKDNPLYQSADVDADICIQSPIIPTIDNSLGLIENTLYQSADDVINVTEGDLKIKDRNNITDLYSEINNTNKENKVDETHLHYDYVK